MNEIYGSNIFISRSWMQLCKRMQQCIYCFTNDRNLLTKVINKVSYDWPIDSHSDTSLILCGSVLMLWLTLS